MPDNRSIEIDKEIQENQNKWEAETTSIQHLKLAIEKIDARLKSWSLRLNDAIGLGRPDISIEKSDQIAKLDINNLSKSDLETRKKQLIAKIQEKDGIVSSLQATIDVLKNENKKLDKKEKTVLQVEDTEKYVQEFTDNPEKFFSHLLSTGQLTDPQLDHDVLFGDADRIIAVSSQFTRDTDKKYLKQAWDIIAAAEKLASKDYAQHLEKDYVQDARIIDRKNVYSTAKEETLVMLKSILPEEMQDPGFRAEMFDTEPPHKPIRP